MNAQCIPYLLPVPKSIKMDDGIFTIDDNTAIVLEAGTSPVDLLTAERLKDELLRVTGFDVYVLRQDRSDGMHNIVLRIQPNEGNPEAYRIQIDTDSILIEGASSAGLRYGVETILQIVNQRGMDIPALVIEDSPDYAVRGFYHDATRGQVPTLDTMKHIADLCVAYKMNHLELYIEHAFLFRSMREIGAGMDPITAEDILALDRYCRDRHIDLVPSISTFGHMYEILRTRNFYHLNELDMDAGELPYNWRDRMQHYTLDVNNPGSLELIKRMFEEYLPLFSSDYVNICCDETFDLGKGKNAGTPAKDLYIKHLLEVIDLVRTRGKRPLFWGDMVLEYEELLEKLPKDAVVLNWHYGENPPEETAEKFAKTGLTQYLCPGVSAWYGFAALISAAEINITKMSNYGKKYHATGFLNTNWGDHGHINLWAVSMHGFIMGAARGWNVADTPAEGDFDAAFSAVVYGDQTKTLGSLLRRLGDADVFRFWITDDKPFDELLAFYQKFPDMTPERIKRTRKVAVEVKAELEHLRVSASAKVRADYDEFIWAASMIIAVGDFALIVFGEDVPNREALASEFERLYDAYAKLWRRRNKESELFRIREAMLRTARRIRESQA